jgi:hypothetical protein
MAALVERLKAELAEAQAKLRERDRERELHMALEYACHAMVNAGASQRHYVNQELDALDALRSLAVEPEAEQPAQCTHCGADTGHYSYCPEAPWAPSKPMLGPVEAFRRELIAALRSAICAHGTGGGVAITVLTVLASSLESDLAGGKRD